MSDLAGLKIGFFGSPIFSLKFLEELERNKANILFVVTQPPSRSGRGKEKNLTSVHAWAKEKKINIYTPISTNEDDFYNALKKIKVDIAVVVAYGKIINERIINLPKYFMINVHASLLPRWRGAAPIHRAILSGDKRTGVTIMRVVKGLDLGPSICECEIKISEKDTLGSLSEKIEQKGKPLMIKAIKKILTGNYDFKPQDSSKATYAEKIDKLETKIRWNESAEKINLKIRAFNPFPGAWTTLGNSGERIKILKGKVLDSYGEFANKKNLKNGSLSKTLVVKCQKGFIQVEELQKPGKKKISNKDFLNSNRVLEDYFE